MGYVPGKAPSLYSGYDSSNLGGSSVILTKVFMVFLSSSVGMSVDYLDYIDLASTASLQLITN
jgi:hypothetical protein